MGAASSAHYHGSSTIRVLAYRRLRGALAIGDTDRVQRRTTVTIEVETAVAPTETTPLTTREVQHNRTVQMLYRPVVEVPGCEGYRWMAGR